MKIGVRIMRNILLLTISFLLILTIGCKDGSKESGKETTKEKQATTTIVQLSSKEQAEAKKIYAAWCSGCHGDKGKGDGPAAAVVEVNRETSWSNLLRFDLPPAVSRQPGRIFLTQ
jgi:cytochrome c553